MKPLNEVINEVWVEKKIKPGDFLDKIRFERNEGLLPDTWFNEPSEPLENLFSEWWKASWVVACLHQLCLEFNIKIPHWILDQKWILDKPYWANGVKNGNLHVILIYESPYPFRARNIYVGKNVMKRV